MPDGWQDDMAQISQPIDFLGMNYYTRNLVTSDPDSVWPHVIAEDGPGNKTQMGWEIFPKGLHGFLTRMARDYVGDLPIYVTENGLASPDVLAEGRVEDTARIADLEAHLEAVRRAIDAGAPVAGYFGWSLLDNYEWSEGYSKRFGIHHVDYETMERTPKASAHFYADVIRTHGGALGDAP